MFDPVRGALKHRLDLCHPCRPRLSPVRWAPVSDLTRRRQRGESETPPSETRACLRIRTDPTVCMAGLMAHRTSVPSRPKPLTPAVAGRTNRTGRRSASTRCSRSLSYGTKSLLSSVVAESTGMRFQRAPPHAFGRRLPLAPWWRVVLSQHAIDLPTASHRSHSPCSPPKPSPFAHHQSRTGPPPESNNRSMAQSASSGSADLDRRRIDWPGEHDSFS